MSAKQGAARGILEQGSHGRLDIDVAEKRRSLRARVGEPAERRRASRRARPRASRDRPRRRRHARSGPASRRRRLSHCRRVPRAPRSRRRAARSSTPRRELSLARASSSRAAASSPRAIRVSARSTCACANAGLVWSTCSYCVTASSSRPAKCRMRPMPLWMMSDRGFELECPLHLRERFIEAGAGREKHRVPLSRRRVAGIEVERARELGLRAGPVPFEAELDERERRMPVREALVELQCGQGGRAAVRDQAGARRRAQADGDERTAIRQAGVRQRVTWDPPPRHARRACARS